MPLRRQMMPNGPHMRLFEQVAFGRLAQIHLLDDRQYRSPQPCAAPGRGGATTVEDCQERLDSRITMLRDVQERWPPPGRNRPTAHANPTPPAHPIAQPVRKP